MKKVYFNLLFSVIVALLPACGVKSAAEKAADEIDRHIYTLQNESSQWRNVLQQTVTDLQKAGQTMLANEVQNVVTRSISATGEEARFNVDFLGKRSEAVLRNVINALRGSNEVFISPPAIASWTPTKVDLYLPPDRRTSLDFSGYDLANKTKDGTGLRLLLVLSDNTSADVSSHFSLTTFYHSVVNTSGSGIQFPQNSKALRLLWGSEQLSEIPVLVPKFSWHRTDSAGNRYSKTFSHISENLHNVKGGKKTSGVYHLEVPNARIYQVDFRHEGDGAPWNYHTTNAPPNEYAGDIEIINEGKSFLWKRYWVGKPTTEVYTALYEVWTAD